MSYQLPPSLILAPRRSFNVSHVYSFDNSYVTPTPANSLHINYYPFASTNSSNVIYAPSASIIN